MISTRALTFIGLNIIRALSIIALLLAFSSNVVSLVNDIKAVNRSMTMGRSADDYILGSTVPNQPAGPLWAVVNRLIIISQTIILVLSEVTFPAVFFDQYFPVLGNAFGLGAIGIFQMLIGAAVLSHHVDTFARVSATFLFSIGCLNAFVGLVFRESAKSKRSITSWREDAKSVLPTHVAGVNSPPGSPSTAMSSPSFISTLYAGGNAADDRRGSDFSTDEKKLGFGRQAEKSAASDGCLLSKPIGSPPVMPPPAHTPSRSSTS